MRFVNMAICGMFLAIALAACGGESDASPPSPTSVPPTLLPTLTWTPLPTNPTVPLEPTEIQGPTPTPEPTAQILVDLAEGQEIDPPVRIALPEGWQQYNRVQLYKDLDGNLRLVPATIYVGPVTSGTGYIVLLWAFENVVTYNPVTGAPGELNLHADGLRLLRFVVLEPGCVVGTDVEREFEVGGLPATGTFFSAIGCEETVDTRGWFAVLQQDNVNFAFYVYTEPLEAMNGIAMAELERILDTVTFHVQEMILAATPRADE